MEMHLSIFDDEDQRMEEIDQRCKDYRRLGSFFKPWYWGITDDELYKHFDIKKLEELSNKVTWIKYDNFIKGIKAEITQRNWFANYISHIVLNSYIVSDEIYDDLKNHRKLNNFEFTYKLDKTNEEILSIIKECCDDTIKDNIYTKLYITESDAIPEINARARFVLHFNIYYPGFNKISIAFDDLF